MLDIYRLSIGAAMTQLLKPAELIDQDIRMVGNYGLHKITSCVQIAEKFYCISVFFHGVGRVYFGGRGGKILITYHCPR